MSARYEITSDQWGEPLINGSRAIMWSDTALINAIRQQSADIAELRAELAAVTAERDGRVATLEICAETLRNHLSAAVRKYEQAEARLAAIDNAPTAAWASADLRSVFVDHELAAKCADVRELIAKPAKD